ncbi:elongator complex protein 5-like [Biomphalaria glabrata]|uniref:Elongator complex protein 5 n=1 Tax=Biomphalaria glabrata TaxID=6526 RepID=A0A9W2YZ08_BIOGL|nr:elongator complex protein 5-like [Biomphalaria glabrata]
MLDDLLAGQEKSKFILMQDAADGPGRYLLLNWARNLYKRVGKTILVCYERPPQYFTEWLPKDATGRITFIDGNLRVPASSEGGCDILFEKEITEAISGPTCILFDSLTLPILLRQVPQTCAVLHRLITNENVLQVLALIHKDIHDQHTCDLLSSLATSIVDVSPVSLLQHKHNIRHCRVTGKVFKTVESVTYDSELNVKTITPWTSTTDVPASSITGPQVDPLAKLSFNLSLTETEKEARSQVKLPYIKDIETEISSRIIYQPDEADDIDDEDPDEDLDI